MKKEKAKITPGRSAGRPGAWLKLLTGIGAVILFMVVAGTMLRRIPGFDSMAAFIEKEGIRSTAIYYTDIKEFAEAEVSLRNNFAFFIANSHGHGPKPKAGVSPAFGPH